MRININICFLSLILIIIQLTFKNSTHALNRSPLLGSKNKLFIAKNDQNISTKTRVNFSYKLGNKEQQKLKQLTDKKEDWSEWQSWKNFPHNQIQLGFSNSDYGAMMDLEYKCFGEVSNNNNSKKLETYWYRIAKSQESSKYFQVEVGCWQANKFKATSIVNGLKINYQSLSHSNSQLLTQTIKHCPREFTGWNIIRTFETKSYSLALCQQNDSIYLVGHEKGQYEGFISAKVLSQNAELTTAKDDYGFFFEIMNNQLKVTENNNLISQETILNSGNKPEKQDDSKSQLIGVVWQLQQILYNNDELIEVDNPSDYTIEFLPDGQLNIKADCNRAIGSYIIEGSSISINIGPTTRAMCPPESISDQYLKELQSATIFFFKDGDLYLDLKFDTGTMKFISEQKKTESEENQETESTQSQNSQNTLGFSGPSSVENELQEDAVSRQKRSLLPGVDNALQPWFNWKQEVNQDVGLNFGLDYNTVYQKLTNSLNFDEAGGGIFRFFGDWTLVGRNTDHPGAIVFKVENRHDFSRVAPQNLGFQAGYSGITSTQFSDYGWGVTNLYWKQRFNNGKISFLIGKVDPTDYLDVYGLINPLTAFQNLAFATNPTIAAPNQGLGMALGAMLSDNVYLITGFSDANGDATKAGFDTFFNEAEFFKHIEIGWTTSQERIYFDNIHLTAWHSDARDKVNIPETWGLTFSAAWFVDDLWMPFLRAGYSNGGASLMKGSVSAGLGRYFPETGNLFGFGFNWGQPADTSLNSQVTTELFYRIQLTQNWAITPDIQVLFNPALSPDKSAIAVFGIRSRLNF